MGNAKTVHMWFTPVNLRIMNNILYTDRMDILIDNDLHICTWGNINLQNKRLNMNLGLTAYTLENIFGLSNLDPDYVITIPITGTLDKPKLDSSGATASAASAKRRSR